ncbi:hypothetical protein, partial [Salmonella sp. SAL4432]|uniref:hypothetical protein n=1 Tax=Salmonella sp. SAL4432 TaxID=3159887 RepID=UPI00397CA27E
SPGQGLDPLADPWVVDESVQVATPETDVLFVLDNSSSMDAERDEVLRNMPLFMSWFVDSGLDWHVGVVSTDVEHEGY